MPSVRSFLKGIFPVHVQKFFNVFVLLCQLMTNLLDAVVENIDRRVNVPGVVRFKTPHKDAHFLHQRKHMAHQFLSLHVSLLMCSLISLARSGVCFAHLESSISVAAV